MVDIIADIFRAVVTGALFFYLHTMRKHESPRLQKAWIFIIIGFGFFFFGGILAVAENFPNLSRYLIIGRTPYGDLLEEGIGYLVGLVFLGIGFWRWIPAIIALRAEEAALRVSHEALQRRIIELTEESKKLQNLLECSHASAHAADIQSEKGERQRFP